MSSRKDKKRPRERRRTDRKSLTKNKDASFNVGFVHKLVEHSEHLLDKTLLDSLGTGPFELAPYTTNTPRHITSLLPVDIDGRSMRFLNLGLRLSRMGISADEELMEQVGIEIASSAGDVQSNRKKQLACKIADVVPIRAGLGIAARVDCAYVNEVRSTLSRSLQEAGVKVPDMHGPHIALAQTGDRHSSRRLLEAGSSLVGMEIMYERVEPYFNRYTSEVTPMIFEDLSGNRTVMYEDPLNLSFDL